MASVWLRRPRDGSDTCILFVHGILSSGDSAWGSEGGNWPALLAAEPDRAADGIYVVSYYTDVFSGRFTIANAVDSVKEDMRMDGVLRCRRLVFVCHSMGGIVIRKYLVERASELIRDGKEIGLFLVASPSLGSGYADWLAPLARVMRHEQADKLRILKNNPWLAELDKEFTNLKEAGQLPITGKELLEDKSIVLPGLLWRQVVQPHEGGKIFGESIKVELTDHFSIAKPASAEARQHRLLRSYLDHFTATQPAARIAAVHGPAAPSGAPAGPFHLVLDDAPAGTGPAVALAAELEARGHVCWVPARALATHGKPLHALDGALRRCASVIVILDGTDNRTAPLWERAIRYKKAITVLHTAGQPDCPLALTFRRSYDLAAAGAFDDIAERLTALDTPRGMLENLSEQLAAVRHILLHVPADLSERYRQEIRLLEQEIGGLALNGPDAATRALHLSSGLLHESRVAREHAPHTRRRVRVVNAPPLDVPPYFENRTQELALIGKFLHEPSYCLLTIHGRGGIGKTALTCKALLDVERARQPGGGAMRAAAVVYINAVKPSGNLYTDIMAALVATLPLNVQAGLRALFGQPALTPTRMICAVLAHLQHGNTVVFIDNLEDLVDPASGHIRDADIRTLLLTTAAQPRHCLKLIVTTRAVPEEFATIGPARQARLTLAEGLNPEHADQMLRRMDFDGGAGLRDAPAGVLRRVADHTRGFPRALEAFYAIVAGDPGREIDDVLADIGSADVGTEGLTQALVGEAYSRLLPMQTKVMEALSIFSPPVPRVAVEYVLGEWSTSIDSGSSLDHLVALHFVRRKGDRYFLHPIDRDFALSQMTSEHRNAMRMMAVDYFEEIGQPYGTWTSSSDLEPYLQQFRLCLEAGYTVAAALRLGDLNEFMMQRGMFEQVLALANEVAGADADKARAIGLRCRAQALWRLGRDADAIATQQTLIELLDRQHEAGSDDDRLNAEGDLLLMLPRRGATMALLERCRRHVRRRQETCPEQSTNLASAMMSLGHCHGQLGYLVGALKCGHRANRLATREKDLDTMEASLNNVGVWWSELGAWARAESCFRAAAQLTEHTHNPLWQSCHLLSLADCAQERGCANEAQQHLSMALRISEEIGDLDGTIMGQQMQGRLALDADRPAHAIAVLAASLQYARQLKHPLRDSGLALAEALYADGQHAEALTVLTEVDDTSQGQRWGFDNLLGATLLRQGQPDSALACFTRALAQCDLYLSRCRCNRAALGGRVQALTSLGVCGDEQAATAALQDRALFAARAGAGALATLNRRLRWVSPDAGKPPA